MSAIVRGLQIFSGLGAVATTPFALQLTKKHINQLSNGRDRLVLSELEEKPVPQPETKLNPQEAIEKAKKIMEKEGGEGEKKCFWWPTKVRGLELLGCVYSNKLDQVFLFHWDVNNKLGLTEKLNQIVSLAHGAQMKFENNQWVPLTPLAKLIFAWLHKWSGDFIPKQHCSITESGEGKKSYTLTCGSQQQEKNQGRPFVDESINL